MHSWFKNGVAVALCTCAGAARAQEDAPSSGWDVSFRAGAAHLQDNIVGFPHQDRYPYEFRYSAGAALSVAARYRFTPRLRGEIEATTRRHDLSESSPAGSAEQGRLDLRAFMLNAYYDFEVKGPWRPYVGIGVGEANVTFENFVVGDTLLVNDDARAASVQLIGGFEYDLGRRWRATVDYRYVQTRDLLVVNDEGDVMATDQRNHAMLLGLSRRF